MVARRQPVIDRPIEDAVDLIDHLIPLLKKQFGNEVSNVYFGDIGVYLPSHFLGPRKDQRAILALSPGLDAPLEDGRTAAATYRLITVDIIGLVNITAEFEASPEEAFGERRLALLMRKVRTFLEQQKNINLDGRVQYLDVGAIRWNWMQRDKLAIRGAALEVTARVRVSRQKTQ